jgi:hypothetical protein
MNKPDSEGSQDEIEIRMDGPSISEVSKDYFRVGIEVSILASAILGDTSFHTIHAMVGDIANCFTNIEVFRLGSEDIIENDGDLIGCLYLIQSPHATRGNLDISHYGQVQPSLPLIRSSVEGHYQAHFSAGEINGSD